MNILKVLEDRARYIRTRNWSGPEKVAMYQLMYRLLCFDSSIYTVLHGSTSITKNGNAVLFGDGIDCIGKTSTALQVAFDSKLFVNDEFTLHNEATGTVYGNKEMPMLIRNSIKEYLGDMSKEINWTDDEETHVLPSDIGIEVVSGSLKAIIAPHFITEKHPSLVEERNFDIKKRKVAIVANAHRLKLTEAGLDRANGETVTQEKIELIDWTAGYKIPSGLMNIPYYDAYLNCASDIISLLNKEGL